MSQDQYDAGYLPDDADCDQDLVRFHLGASHEFYTVIIEQLAEQLSKANERIEQLEEQNNFLKRPVNEQIKKANERVEELEREITGTKAFLKRYRFRVKGGQPMQKAIDDVLEGRNGYLDTILNKFALEQKIEALENFRQEFSFENDYWREESMAYECSIDEVIEQLLKEQDNASK